MSEEVQSHLVIFALGSNKGDRKFALNSALEMLEITVKSKIYETEALLPQDAPANWNVKFLNMVGSGHTEKSPEELLCHIQNIEKLIGRETLHEHWSPRIIDIDILFYEDKIIKSENLIIPHPELTRRKFVLQPLCDILPNYIHPVYRKTAKELLEEISG